MSQTVLNAVSSIGPLLLMTDTGWRGMDGRLRRINRRRLGARPIVQIAAFNGQIKGDNNGGTISVKSLNLL